MSRTLSTRFDSVEFDLANITSLVSRTGRTTWNERKQVRTQRNYIALCANFLFPVHMKDLTNSASIKFKGFLFLLLGIIAATLLVLENPTLKVALLLALTVWCFCRAYYFAFYVIEKYVDPSYKFSGLCSFAKYIVTKKVPRHGAE